MTHVKLLLIALLLLFINISGQDPTPTVENVTFTQRTDGTLIIDVYYDVDYSEGDIVMIFMKASNDNGNTWNFSCNNLSGDIGSDIPIGTGKHIEWDFGSEHTDFCCDQILVKVIATEPVPCGVETVDYLGQTYNTVQIGDQCWLKENLNVGERIDAINPMYSANNILEKYCFEDNELNCTIYGGLYYNDEALQGGGEGTQGICPEGWHVPTENEWETLFAFVNDDADALKAVGEGTGTNTSGFTGLIGGYWYLGISYMWIEGSTAFWSSTRKGQGSTYFSWEMADSSSTIWKSIIRQANGFSVRCLKN